MNNTFLSQLADQIIALGINLSKTAIVLPNKRAKRILLKELSSHFQVPIFAPEIFTINDFVAFLSPLEKLEKFPLLVSLYKTYHNRVSEQADDFNVALSWMPAFIEDMSEVEKQLDDGCRILQDLAYAKDFELSIGHDDLSKSEEQKMLFYHLLSDLYENFKHDLLEQHQAYDGLLYRDCAENIESYSSQISFQHFVFAGFHVLNPAELKIVKFFKDHFDTHFYFDVDPFYCDFSKNERFTTAHFLNKICDQLSLSQENILFKESHFASIPKEVQIVGTSKDMNQIFYAIQCLDEIKKQQGNLDNTALVLADEKLLPALLSAYDIDGANVTMGYPFKETPAYTLLSLLLDMYQTGMNNRLTHQGVLFFHRRDIITLLHNPLIKNYLFEDDVFFEQQMDVIEQEASIFLNPSELDNIPLPRFQDNIAQFVDSIVDYLQKILQKVLEKEAQSEAAMLQLLVERLQEVQQQVQPLVTLGCPITMATLRFAIRQNLDNVSLPIKGDAMKGLQIMGLLETRTLDFKNVIVLSVNEGVLPAGISFNSILPFDFKFHDETLENYLYKDQVYAYHFFRLLQRAENITLLYDNNCSSGMAEKSRFITQLEFEVREQKMEDVVRFSYPKVFFPYYATANKAIEVEKTEKILEKLKGFTYSASSLKTYIQCPLKFYWLYVCGLRPRVSFKEKIESNVIGTLVHAVFEHVFSVKEDSNPNFEQRIDLFLANLNENIKQLILSDKTLQKAFPMKEKDMDKGRIYLALCMVNNYVKRYLEKAKSEMLGVTVLENELELSISMNVAGQGMRLKGNIDRLQWREDHIEVIDYKTGKVDEKYLKVSMDNLSAVFTDPQYGHFIQLFFYALLCRYTDHSMIQKYGVSAPIQCAIVSIVEMSKGNEYLLKAQLSQSKKKPVYSFGFTEEYMNTLESALKELLLEIVNPQKKIQQTKQSDYCFYCDYKHMCGR